jgi:hypothetical protein
VKICVNPWQKFFTTQSIPSTTGEPKKETPRNWQRDFIIILFRNRFEFINHYIL